MSLSRTQVDNSWLSAVITNTQESNIHTTLFTLCVSLKQQAKKVWWSKKGVTFCKKKLCPHFFSFIWFYFFLSLPLIFIFICTISTAYMCWRDAVYYIYTHHLGNLTSPLTWRGTFYPPFIHRAVDKCGPMHHPRLLSWWLERGRWWGKKCSLGWKWEKLGKKQSICFSKPHDCHQCCKKGQIHSFKDSVNIAHSKYSV